MTVHDAWAETSAPIEPPVAARLLADLGFLDAPDLPDRPGHAYLLVAIRDQPTLRHFDPEVASFWVTELGHGSRIELDRTTPMPVERDFSWGTITITDRLKVSNEYLTFGGQLRAARVGDASILVFESPAPLVARGGHSQSWDMGADSMAAFFGRLMVAVDFAPGFEAQVAAAEPLVRYAAFVDDTAARYRASQRLREDDPRLWRLLRSEASRLQAHEPTAWADGQTLLAAAAPVQG